MRRSATTWSIAGLALLATALSGCVAGDDDAVFGPEDGEGAVVGSAESLSVLFKAKPARGPSPLAVQFSLDVRGAGDPGMAWSIDFGNGSRGASGDRLPALASHNFTEVGSHEVTATVRTGGEATRSRLVLVVLPANAPAADPEEEVEGETMPDPEEGETEDDGEVGGGTSTTSSPSSSPTSGPSSSTSPSTSPPSATSSPSSSPTSSSTTANPTSTSATSTAPPPPSDNHPPQATLVASRTSGEAPLDVSFTIDASDPEGQPIEWTLDARDDGTIEASGDRGDVPRTITHRFDQPGTYATVLRVTDGVSTTTRTVTVTAT